MKKQQRSFVFVIILYHFTSNVNSATLPSCNSPIYCQGDLLHTVQYTYDLFDDSKHFVDLTQKNDPSTTLKNFKTLMDANNNNPSKEQLLKFISDNFMEEGEFEQWTPEDFQENPPILNKIEDKEMRSFVKELNKIWLKLGRKTNSGVQNNPERHSQIYLPNGFIVPGGRFKEIYYWDSYWIIDGLLICQMHKTVRGILDNFVSLVQQFGFIPNGSRVYYLNRSQPPLFSLMVERYIEETKDLDWLKANVKFVEDELNWWLTNRTVEVEKDGNKYTLARYACASGTPRPESYAEDLDTCQRFKSNAVESCYKNLKSGAESGWDFSSRWIFAPDPFEVQKRSFLLPYINTYRVVPVDLNAYLCAGFKNLAKFYELIGNENKAAIWSEKGSTWQKSIEAVFYDRDDGIWYDFDLTTQTSRKAFYPSNFAPLWLNTYSADKKLSYGAKATDYLTTNVPISKYGGGIPTSLVATGEQWDNSNAWPPLQDIVVTGLYNTGNKKAMDTAVTYAKLWVKSNQIGFSKAKKMYEKYDATVPGEYGGGGEYVVQDGFGWTNGVVISLLNRFPQINAGMSSIISISAKYLICILLLMLMSI